MSDFRFQDQFDPERFNVYLAGPLTDCENPEKIHDKIIGKAELYVSEINWIDPMDLEPEFASGWEMIRKDLTAVEEVDGVFAYRPGGCESWGTKFEVIHALRANTPVVIWNIDGGEHNHWAHLPFTMEDELKTALDAMGAKMRIRW